MDLMREWGRRFRGKSNRNLPSVPPTTSKTDLRTEITTQENHNGIDSKSNIENGSGRPHHIESQTSSEGIDIPASSVARPDALPTKPQSEEAIPKHTHFSETTNLMTDAPTISASPERISPPVPAAVTTLPRTPPNPIDSSSSANQTPVPASPDVFTSSAVKPTITQRDDDVLRNYTPIDWVPSKPLDIDGTTFHGETLDRQPSPKSGRWPRLHKELRPRMQHMRLQYKYTRLKPGEIRLLFVHKGSADDLMRCQILRRKLNDPLVKNRFNALSYHWGPDDPDKEIHLTEERPGMAEFEQDIAKRKGTMSILEVATAYTKAVEQAAMEKWFKVRDNLWNCLHALRSPKQDILLWVDAICIDQETEGSPEAAAEKDAQIAMMAQIYSSAYSVCVWLGENDEKSAKGMDFICKLVHIPHLDSIVTSGIKEHREGLDALRAGLMQYRWFSRRWVVQEISLARKASVHIGDKVGTLYC
jgi:hypothetical protein